MGGWWLVASPVGSCLHPLGVPSNAPPNFLKESLEQSLRNFSLNRPGTYAEFEPPATSH